MKRHHAQQILMDRFPVLIEAGKRPLFETSERVFCEWCGWITTSYLVAYVIRNGRIQLRWLCQNGNHFTKRGYNESCALAERRGLTIPADLFKVQRMDYVEYLQSPVWAETRVSALEAAKWQCGRCGIRDEVHRARRGFGLDVHHRTYDRLGRELPEDLEVLCRGCHDRVHRPQLVTSPPPLPDPLLYPLAAAARHYED